MAIHSNNFFYNILLKYVLFVYNFAFRKIDIVGRENIPTDGAIIFAPNHTNAFMDAFTVLKIARRPVVFVARADVFRNPIAAKIFHFFKIMPIMRMRDGRENLKKNDQIIQTSVDVLKARVPFTIFCEGTHRMKHSILPLVKGIFRIALQADDELNGELPVYIVPVGIEYGDYTRYRSTIAVQIGKPFDVSEFNRQNSDKSQPELMNLMRSELSQRISSLYHCVPDTEDYEALLDLCYLNSRPISPTSPTSLTRPIALVQSHRQALANLHQLEQNNPIEYQQLIHEAKQFAVLRRRLGIADDTIRSNPSHAKNLLRIVLQILTLPYFLFCAVIDLPVSLITWLLFHFIIEDGAMKNSLRMLFVVLLYPFIFMALAIAFFHNLSAAAAIILLIAALPANALVHDYVRTWRMIFSDYKYLRLLKSHLSINDKIINE